MTLPHPPDSLPTILIAEVERVSLVSEYMLPCLSFRKIKYYDAANHVWIAKRNFSSPKAKSSSFNNKLGAKRKTLPPATKNHQTLL